MDGTRLLAGPSIPAGAESFAAHTARLGPLPASALGPSLIDVIDASGLRGRGGASFPVGRKWRAVADRASGSAVILVNGAEGEPLSHKDRTLMTVRPHLVLDGAILAAAAVGADRIVIYVGTAHRHARAAIDRALAERGPIGHPPITVLAAPDTYVAGEESAAVHFVNAADARPTTTPPRPFERGVGGRPTLVQNVETLAHAALIARFGDAWYRQAGRDQTPGTALVTLSGIGRHGPLAVREIELGTTLGELATWAGIAHNDARAVLLGGYFGGWSAADEAWDRPLDPATMREAGRAFGCGVVGMLDGAACGVVVTARLMDYMAGQSAAQCGPCVFGLRAIADATERLATGSAAGDDLRRIGRWSEQLAGRGACRHPDGAVGLMHSALEVFDEDFVAHQRNGHCSRDDAGSLGLVPARGRAA
jgi:NADH:ubiquinone oxidoreductase subunit F (NADH-binding)